MRRTFLCVCVGGGLLYPIPQVERNTSACGTNPASVKVPLVANDLGGLGEDPILSSRSLFSSVIRPDWSQLF